MPYNHYKTDNPNTEPETLDIVDGVSIQNEEYTPLFKAFKLPEYSEIKEVSGDKAEEDTKFFISIPEYFHTYNAQDYDPEFPTTREVPEKNIELDILSPKTSTRHHKVEAHVCITKQEVSLLNQSQITLPEQGLVGVKFRDYGPVFYCTAGGMTLALGDFVMIDCEQGLGKVVRIITNPPSDLSVLLLDPNAASQGLPENITIQQQEIPAVLSLADDNDLLISIENTELVEKAKVFCHECIQNLNLEMKLVDVEIFHDRSKIVFYFTAPTRIDFRELVKELVKNYRTRIELRQIGVRHETQMLGGIGNCGASCCCRKYLRRFAPVTIKMAKEQNLFLNPAKISGLCGRLLCCLSYEQENYEHFNKQCPKIGKRYTTHDGIYKVLRVNMFRASIFAQLDGNEEEQEFNIDEWNSLSPKRFETSNFEENSPLTPELE
ncbi:PSP1 domain-containing protein [Desulfovibrio litoralis]|uniref:Cell fate regulator YaaT, PSP1 superfamily (Controls sporulation, competence, biofilm development) n=1 Tax=Desulfovibrio litoralis DSM 11393 TaxID=1121455 RepID=A0A1M7SY64_9BACT|nr:regulatory iron-sulfur-containing complex subunit RicT [Desulfovibrio litoralis]SHN63328.1 Cell fate regulator YaaT, PSP1 superfamily (controls sporulation, competence, biofilm development) [Desulfovibrio litoralis DSM 11393]